MQQYFRLSLCETKLLIMPDLGLVCVRAVQNASSCSAVSLHVLSWKYMLSVHRVHVLWNSRYTFLNLHKLKSID